MANGVLCDTSFVVRLLDQTDPLHPNARAYYRYLLHEKYTLYLSTIAVAEYCVQGTVDELPLRNLQILAFNLHHAAIAGQFARFVFDHKKKEPANQLVSAIQQRNIIPNDTKLFAQAQSEKEIGYYLTSDSRSHKIYQLLQKVIRLDFQFWDINTPYTETFGLLNFE